MEDLKSEQLSAEYEEFLKVISDQIDKKFEKISNNLLERRNELAQACLLEIKSVNDQGKDLKKRETEILQEGKKDSSKLEEVKEFKKLADDYIKKCEELESIQSSLKTIKLSEILTIKKADLQLSAKSLKFIKKHIKCQDASELKWNKTQKKACTLTGEDSTIQVNFNSCWNDFHSMPLESGEHEIIVRLENLNSSYEYNTIGITNENFNGTTYCIGCQTPVDAYLLRPSGRLFIDGTSSTCSLNLPKTGSYTLIMNLNCDKKTLMFKDTFGKQSQNINLRGSKFKVTFGMCTSGNCTYKFLDNLD